MSENTPTTYTVPDNATDPEGAALELIVRSTEVLDDPVVSAGVQEFAVLLEVEGAFTGMSWPDARGAATLIVFDAVLLLGKAVDSLRRRATDALAGCDGKPWEDQCAAARALNIAAMVLELELDVTVAEPQLPELRRRHPRGGRPERLRIQRAADGDEFLFIREVLLREGYTELEDGTFLKSPEVSQ